MTACSSCDKPPAALVLRGVDVRVLAKLLNQQRQEGQAAVKLIEGSQVAAARGADEPGKGGLVDLVG